MQPTVHLPPPSSATLPQPLLARLLRIRPGEIELLRPMRRATPLDGLLFALGTGALAAALLLAWPAWTRIDTLTQQRDALAAGNERLAAPAARTIAAARARTHGADADRSSLAEAGSLVSDLQRPWDALFDQLEAAAAADGAAVHITSLGVDPHFAAIDLVAESRDLDKLVRFTQRIAAGAQGAAPIRSMTMTHHEIREVMGVRVVSASLHGGLAGAPAQGQTQ